MNRFRFFSFIILLVSSIACNNSVVDNCEFVDCLNGGECIDGTCDCPLGTSGPNCEVIDLCFGVNCDNGGVCVDGACDCPNGFSGENCEIILSCQERLNLGNESPIDLYNEGVLLDSLYGKFYEGGVIFYLDVLDTLLNIEGMVSASIDQSDGIQWGCSGIAVDGADATSIGAGSQNTIEIVNECSDDNFAAKTCSELVLEGYDDWFLPSKDELNLMYLNIALGNGVTDMGNPRFNLGDFNLNFWYWTSTENVDLTSNIVFVQFFNGGLVANGPKPDDYIRLRAARAF